MQDNFKPSYLKLEIDVILKQLYDLAILPLTKSQIASITPQDDILLLEDELTHVDEAQRIIMRMERAPIMMDSDYQNIVALAFKGARLSALEIYETERLFRTIKANQKLQALLAKDHIEAPFYDSLVNSLVVIDYLENHIIKSVNENGEVLDDATPTLKQIRNKLHNIDNRIKSKCQEIMAKEASKLSQSMIVMRNDTYCLLVKNEYKNAIKGTIQDYSASLQTVYIEPEGVSILNIEKNKLFQEEHEEVEKILKSLSTEISYEAEILKINFDTIVELDYLFSKALLAYGYQGNKPILTTDGHLELINARHPLLKVKKVIPNNVAFGKEYEGIIITGPNTGGKTVFLKTVGLLVLMTKYGLLIPADANSKIMLYDDVYCDIGDDQSIQNNLSTFSSHMGNIVSIINQITPKSLVLFDEIGAGTDPIEGSNLAIAILKYLLDKHISFITTTHYSDLKAFAFEDPRIINASMEFDQQTLSPTYHLLIGVSGSSNALNIASRLGLNSEIIKEAQKLTITNDDEVRKLIIKLEKMLHQQNKKNQELELLLHDTKEKQQTLTNELAKITQERDNVIKKAEEQAKEIIDKTQKTCIEMLDEIKKHKNNNLKLHEVIDLKHRLDELDYDLPIKKTQDTVEEDIIPTVGQDVFITSYAQYGTITRILKNDSYEIMIGNLRLTLKKSEFKVIKQVPKVKEANVQINQINKSKANVQLVLDLRGERVLEAKDLLDKYLDDLTLVGIKQATIIHGYGTGALRELVQTYLKSAPQIASYRYGGENEGGFGVTIINLK